MILRVLFFLLSIYTFAVKSLAQNLQSTEDFVYNSNIKTVQFYQGSNPLSYPISNVRASVKLNFEFDDLNENTQTYFYKIVHCDRDWKKSNLEETDYLAGYNGIEIKDYENSIMTLNHYTHFYLSFPNSNTRWTISGNYLLIIYNENDEISIVRRFLVSENVINIDASIDHTKDVSKYYTHHNLYLALNNKDYNIVDPLKELTVNILQNFKWFDAITNISPKYVLGNEITFDQFDPFTFKAQNEFRYIDTRSLRSTNIEIHTINVNRNGVDVVMETDKMRNSEQYYFYKDLNGNFVTLNLDEDNINKSQYTKVHFKLKTYAPVKSQKVFVLGAFCEWQPYEENELTYDPEFEGYTGTILLKQGVYDYCYAFVDEKLDIDIASLEGSYFDTKNDYTILVYQRPFGGRYDKLLAVRSLE